MQASPIPCSEFATNIVVNAESTFGNVTLVVSASIDNPDAFDFLCYCVAFPVNNRLIYLADITGLNITDGNLTVDELPPASSMQCLTGLNSLSLSGQSLPDGPPSDLIATHSGLKVLDMSHSHIERLSSSTMALLPNLSILDLRDNALALLPSDVFANSRQLSKLYLDDNFILDLLPQSIFANMSSLSLVSHFNTPRLSCLPPVSFNSPFDPGSLPTCSVMSSFHKVKLLGGSISCRQLRLSDAHGWVIDSDVNETIIDLSTMSRIDTSRFVNAAIVDQGTTTAFIVDVLPSWRHGQVDAKSLVPLIKMQLLDAQSILMSGIITKQLTSRSLVVDVPVIRRYCKTTGLYQADADICPTPAGSFASISPEQLYPLIAVAAGIVAGIVIVQLSLRYTRKSIQLGEQTSLPLQHHLVVNSSVLVPMVHQVAQGNNLHSSLPYIYSNAHQFYGK